MEVTIGEKVVFFCRMNSLRARRFFTGLSLILVLFGTLSFAKYSGGSGEPNDPYLIATPEDLNSIGLDPCDWDKHFLMTVDINMADITGDSFNIIGHWDEPFTGVFDGNNYSISNFIYESELSSEVVGMFGRIENIESLVKDVTLIKPFIEIPYGQAGALVGQLYSGEIINCTVMNGEKASTNHVGGLAGVNRGIISDCHVQVSVFGENWIGGLVGLNRGRISACSANGTITGLLAVGGLVGTNYSVLGKIDLSYARTDVLGDADVGGLAGKNESGIISNCYSLGTTESYGNGGGVGGLVGDDDHGIISSCFTACRVAATEEWIGAFLGMEASEILNSCFWDKDINPDVNGIGFGDDPNVIGLPTAELQKRATFADAGWDMINVWDIGENQTYPFLRTHLPSDINKDGETNLYDLAILALNWLEQ